MSQVVGYVMNDLVRSYIPLVDFLEQVLGTNSEIVLHDFTDPDHAIVDIRNGQVSGRAKGGPATDLALKIINENAYADHAYITGYESRGAGNKPLRSSTFFIRDDEGANVGMLCINTDTSAVRNLMSLAERFASIYEASPAPEENHARLEVESLTGTTDELIGSTIQSIATEQNLDVHNLAQAERVEVIRQLNANGLFQLKGAVAATAGALGISEPSVYRYLQRVKKEA